jgi:hypothetical protein
MSDTLEMPIDTVKEWLDKETNSLVEPLRADAKKLLEDTKSKLGDLIEASDKLLDDAEKEIAKGSRKTYHPETRRKICRLNRENRYPRRDFRKKPP